MSGGRRPSAQATRAQATGARRGVGDDGTAVIEFVFVALLVMIPLVYLIVAVAVVQRSQLAVAQTAREVGRAVATSSGPAQARQRAAAAERIALAAQGLPDDVTVTFVAAGASCSAAPVIPQFVPGGQFTVCVTRRVALPAVPSVLGGHGITTIGSYLVHLDEYRVITR